MQTRYAYDPLGRRILKASEEHKTTFYWLGDSLLKEQSESLSQGKHSTTYLFEPEQGNGESFKPVAVVKTQGSHSTEDNTANSAKQRAQIYHIHTDHLGTPQEVTDHDGNLVWAPQFKVYGRVYKKHLSLVSGNNALKPVEAFEESPDQDFELNLRFQGQYHDAETGLHYNRHRYYDPDCGQFISQDPIGLLGGLHNYQYVTNPVGWVDPLGLCEHYDVRKEQSPSEFARSWQGSGDYPGIDKYRDITIKKGKIIYGGAPGQGNFYTTESALKRADYNAQKYFDGVQVRPHPVYGYRPGVTVYRVKEDVPSAFGITRANPQHGAGGLPQIVIEHYEDVLEPLYSIPLR